MNSKNTAKRYSDEEQAAFLEHAQDVGIGRAIRDLGYPNSWATAKRWADSRGIEVEINTLKQKAKSYDLWYTDRDALLVAEEGMERVSEQLREKNLEADEIKKLAEAYQKYANTWLLIQGKSTNITESHHKDAADLEIFDIINKEKAKDLLRESERDNA